MKAPEYTNQNPLEQQILPEVRLNVELIQFTALSCFQLEAIHRSEKHMTLVWFEIFTPKAK